MTPHKQLFRHDPEKGIYGDCGRTVIACMLDLEPDQVPHFWEGEPTRKRNPEAEARQWLADRGYTMIQMALPKEWALEYVLVHVGSLNPREHYVLMGESKNGTDHVVICRGAEIVHDPAIDNSGIVGPASTGWWFVEFYARAITGEAA